VVDFMCKRDAAIHWKVTIKLYNIWHTTLSNEDNNRAVGYLAYLKQTNV